MKKTILAILFFCSSHLMTMAQSFPKEIDTTAFVLGLLEYPSVHINDHPIYGDYIIGFDCRKTAIKELFISLIPQKDSIRETQEQGFVTLSSATYKDYLNQHLVLMPYSRPSYLRKELRDYTIQEGYINPYALREEQQESFVLGYIINNADFYTQPISKGAINGKYYFTISYSSAFCDIVLMFMQNQHFYTYGKNTKSRRTHEGYEIFDAIIHFDVPEEWDDFVAQMITLRQQKAEENCD